MACEHWFETPNPAHAYRATWDMVMEDSRRVPRTRSCWLCGLRQWAVFDDATGRYRHVPAWDATPEAGYRGFLSGAPPKEPTPP